MKKLLNIEIGQRVRLTRKKRKLTRDFLAEAINISTLFLGYIECGQKGMSLETLLALSSALHVSCDYLLTGREGSPLPEADHESRHTLHQLVSRVAPEDVPLVEAQLELTLSLLDRAAPEEKKGSPGINAETSHNIMLAARNGNGQALELTPEERARLQELSSDQ